MDKSSMPSATQPKDLKGMLEQRYNLLQKQESLNFGSMIKTAKEGNDSEHEGFSAPTSNTSAEEELTERHINEIHGIEDAFLRIHQDTYGICVDCQSSIDFRRLLAYPTALRCMKCQEAYELLERRNPR